ncbi:TetR/AcrR family transcriptional regulator [Aquisediminimonas sediminicola]|uniref:TetR/AcrR family transcriptional regulator n=1 Tax=Alteraquisediminimonas sediminicola TaxID=2676787 RepID=UPI001C8DE922|nr:TetR/AcrR family transcriptional regulator [Aquisediminimonas sediminicola]
MKRVLSASHLTDSDVDIGRREMNKNRVWQQILLAGEKLFLEQGFNDATVKGIVEEADVSTGTFFNYVRTKDDLLSCLTEVRMCEILGPNGLASIFDPEVIQLLPDAGKRLGKLERIKGLLLIDLRYGKHFSYDVSCNGEWTGWAECDAYVELIRNWRLRGLIRNDADVLLQVMLLQGMANAAIAKWLLHDSNTRGSQLKGMQEGIISVFREGAGIA